MAARTTREATKHMDAPKSPPAARTTREATKQMDAPKSPPAGQQSSAPAAAAFENSPVFNFINTLSPIETLNPPNSVQPVLLFKPSELPPVPSIFTSLQVNPDKESQLTARDNTVQLSQEGFIVNCQMSQTGTSSCIEMSGYAKSASESSTVNCSVNKDIHQSQFASNDCFLDTLKVPVDNMLMDNSLSQHQYGMHRRSLFNEKKVEASSMDVQSVLNLHPAIIVTDNYLNLAGSPACALPDVGLHLNAVAAISKEIMPYNNQASGDPYNIMPFTINPPLLPEHNSLMRSVFSGTELIPRSSEVDTYIQPDHSSQKTMPSANESGKESHRKRRKFQNGDGDSCRRCSCKKSKCLKLYCACFAAKVYCSEFCSCQGCLNNHAHSEAVLCTRKQIESRNPLVLCTRKQIESRNPLAFAPNIIRTCGSSQEFGGNSNKTPASARHKRGCNCRKSCCLKKYCECFESGVGCSISCRCESCKNSFGRREGVPLLKGKDPSAKEEKLEFDKRLVLNQTLNLPSSENLFRTPSTGPCRLPLSSIGCSSPQHNSQPLMKADALLSPLNPYSAEMIHGNGSSDSQEGDTSSCTASIKVVSPNKKRVSPLQIGTSLSPINRSGSGRKLILKSIPSFPSLWGDVNSGPH